MKIVFAMELEVLARECTCRDRCRSKQRHGRREEQRRQIGGQWAASRFVRTPFAAGAIPLRVARPFGPIDKEVYPKNHDKRLEIIGVSCDVNTDALKDFLKADPAMSWIELYEPGTEMNPLAVQYGIDLIPRMLLIDRNGICRTVEARTKLKQLLPVLLAEPVQTRRANDR